ncbi:MAG: hypothetical protein ACK55Z_21385, partial [bacterium]
GATVRVLFYIRIYLKIMDQPYSKIQDIRKCYFLTSMDTARRPYAESLIRKAWNLLAEELGPEFFL